AARSRERMYAWIGALAVSASSEDIAERAWTPKRLFALDPQTDIRLALFSAQVERLVGAREDQTRAALAEVLETVRLLATRRNGHRPLLKPSEFVHSHRLDAAARLVVETLAKGHRLVALRGRPADGKSE